MSSIRPPRRPRSPARAPASGAVHRFSSSSLKDAMPEDEDAAAMQRAYGGSTTRGNHRTTHHRPTHPTMTQVNVQHAATLRMTQHQHQQHQLHIGVGADNDPVLTSRRALVGGKMPASDLNNVNRLFVFIAALFGVALAVVLVQAGANSRALAQWIKLPGELFVNAMLCVIVPTVFLNSVLASMHFWTLNKAKALGYKMLGYFAATTLWASIVGALMAVCCVPLFNEHNLLQAVNPVSLGKPALAFRCPGNGDALVLDTDGGMRCTDAATTNGTVFLLQDLAKTFRVRGQAEVRSIPDVAMQLLEAFFPLNVLQSFLRGDVLNVIIIGVALGMALIHSSACRTRENGPNVGPHNGTGMVFLLIMQCEVILSVLLRFLLGLLPFAMIFMVSGGILEAHSLAPQDGSASADLLPATQDIVTLFGVLFFALLLDLATVMALAMLMTKSNPLKFVGQLLPAQLVALGSSSALIALPTTVRSIAATKQVSMPLAHFVCSTGTVLNKNGSASYLAVAAIYSLAIAGVRDEALTPVNIVLLALASALCSLAVPPMPHGHSVVMGTILASVFGVNEGTARMMLFLAAMEWLCEPFVAFVNVTNDCLIALILAVQMDERFIEYGVHEAEAMTDTQEEDSNDGFPLDESERVGTARGRTRANTVRSAMMERMSSVGDSEVSA